MGDIVNINILTVGDFECNCYLLEKDNDMLIIDPGDDFSKISFNIKNKNLVGIIVTHYHFDHVGVIDELVKKYNVKVYDIHNMCEGENKIGNFNFEVIYTPGHKEDAITIYFREENVMFTGDFLFRDSVGRCDLPGGNVVDMIKSIEKIKEYKDTLVYPGHGKSTSLLYEIENNIYFKDSSILLND